MNKNDKTAKPTTMNRNNNNNNNNNNNKTNTLDDSFSPQQINGFKQR